MSGICQGQDLRSSAQVLQYKHSFLWRQVASQSHWTHVPIPYSIWCDVIPYDTIHYDTIRYNMIWCDMIRYTLLSPQGNLSWTHEMYKFCCHTIIVQRKWKAYTIKNILHIIAYQPLMYCTEHQHTTEHHKQNTTQSLSIKWHYLKS